MCRGEGLWAGPGENNLGEPHLKGRRRRGVGRVTWAVAEGSADMRVRQILLGAGPGGWVTQWCWVQGGPGAPHTQAGTLPSPLSTAAGKGARSPPATATPTPHASIPGGLWGRWVFFPS